MGRKPTSNAVLKKRGSRHVRKKKPLPAPATQVRRKHRVTRGNFSDERIEEIIRTNIPGYDSFDNPGDCTFDFNAARKVIRFFHCKLRHVKGPLAREAFILEDWQIAVFANAFGWKRPNGKRRYRKVFLFVPRKNGKSPMAAGVGLYLLTEDDEPGAEVYGAAREYKQASVVWNYASGMVIQELSLNEKCRIFRGQNKAIEYIDPNGLQNIYRVLAADALSQHGQNTSGYVLDELHAFPDGEMIDVLETSTGAREQPLGFYITTSDYERPGSPCNAMHDYACKVRDGLIDDPTFLPVIHEAPRDADWTDPEVWALANPNLGVSVTLEFMQEQCKKAQDSPAFENVFRRLHLNQRTETDERWIPMDKWRACVGDVDAEALKGKLCYAGLDLASTSDITAFVLVFPIDERRLLLPFFWLPEDVALRRDRASETTYTQFVRDGLIRITPGDVMDYAFVRRDINEIAKQYDIRQIAVDRLFQGMQLAGELREQDGLNVVAFGQGFLSMAAPTHEFDRLIRAGQLEHGGNAVLDWMASNVAVELDAAGCMKPSKKKSSEKIDGIVSAIMAVGMCATNQKKTSVYSTRGIIAV